MTYEDYAKIRDSKGLKDGTIANAIGIGRSTFSDWKSGRSMPKQEKLIKIANYLGVSIEEMLTPSEHIPSLLDYEMQGAEDFALLKKIHSLNSANYSVLISMIDTMLSNQQ